jgi:nucleotide-binding universal stress UspA family protein
MLRFPCSFGRTDAHGRAACSGKGVLHRGRSGCFDLGQGFAANILIRVKETPCGPLHNDAPNQETEANMAYKSLLTVATTPTGLDTVIAAAAGIARRMDAHVDALALGIDDIQVGYANLSAAAMVITASLEEADKEARANESALGAAFAAQGPGLRYAVEPMAVPSGMLGDVIATHAQYADLVILPRPYDKGRSAADVAITEAALFQGMAPVLIVPAGQLMPQDPRHVLIAWNESRESLIATRRAMPFLRRADKVSIVVVDPPAHSPERSDPGGLLCQMLVRHGVRAEVTVLAKTLPRVSEVLARHARDTGADLMVMGAYGHSRLREAILGGATRSMLEGAALPVFLAH